MRSGFWRTIRKMVIAPGLLETSRRKMMNGRRLFIPVDNCAAVTNLGSGEGKVNEGGEAKRHDRLPRSGNAGRRERAHRQLTRTGTLSAKPFTRMSKVAIHQYHPPTKKKQPDFIILVRDKKNTGTETATIPGWRECGINYSNRNSNNSVQVNGGFLK